LEMSKATKAMLESLCEKKWRNVTTWYIDMPWGACAFPPMT
jgi:hypothetical protein